MHKITSCLQKLDTIYIAPKWLRNIAKLISFVFHPVFLPFLGVLFLFSLGLGFQNVSPELRSKLLQLVLAIVGISSVLLPLVAIPMLYSFKIISSLELKQSKERVFPFFLTALSMFWGYMLLRNFPVPVPKVILAYYLAAACTTFLLACVSYFYKVSAHLTGLGGFFALVLFVNNYYLPGNMPFINATLIAVAITAPSRLLLQEHSFEQVLLGFIAGFSVVGFFLYYG